mmetsp:Transcript_19108/g.47950  ORF Transcript_19108/g.47950 Transcript_19108/m.47950 type:complete len:85 (-) Transcript_19108:226-480(-)
MSACPSVESLEAAFGPAEADEFSGDAAADDYKAASPNDAVQVDFIVVEELESPEEALIPEELVFPVEWVGLGLEGGPGGRSVFR